MKKSLRGRNDSITSAQNIIDSFDDYIRHSRNGSLEHSKEHTSMVEETQPTPNTLYDNTKRFDSVNTSDESSPKTKMENSRYDDLRAKFVPNLKSRYKCEIQNKSIVKKFGT